MGMGIDGPLTKTIVFWRAEQHSTPQKLPALRVIFPMKPSGCCSFTVDRRGGVPTRPPGFTLTYGEEELA